MLHILDLPSLAYKPPATVLKLVLKLLAPDEICNFGSRDPVEDDPLESRNVSVEEAQDVLPWLSVYAPKLNSIERLSQVPYSFSGSRDLMKYLTSIISNPLQWVSDAEREEIFSMTSQRLAENCGRTAQPAFKRKILLTGLQERTMASSVILKEPSLTSDNLGLKTWGSSLMLSQRLVKDDKKYLVEPIIELGAGTGLVGITCALLGYSVMLTDLPEIVDNLLDNVDLNGVEGFCQCEVLDWCDSTEFEEKMRIPPNFYNTLLLSDPIYSSKHPQLVVGMASRFLRREVEATVVLQIPVRERFSRERETLWRLLEESGFTECESHEEKGYDDFGEQNFLFKVFKWAGLAHV